MVIFHSYVKVPEGWSMENWDWIIEQKDWSKKNGDWSKTDEHLINMFFLIFTQGIILKVVRKETWKWLDGWFNVNTSRTSLLAQPAKSYPFGHISKFEKDNNCWIQHFPRHIYAGSSNFFLSCWKNIFWEVFPHFIKKILVMDVFDLSFKRKDGWQDEGRGIWYGVIIYKWGPCGWGIMRNPWNLMIGLLGGELPLSQCVSAEVFIFVWDRKNHSAVFEPPLLIGYRVLQ